MALPLSTASASYQKSLSYATSLLRRVDIDSLYPSYFYPPASRPAYLAIRALNVELASIDDQVSNGVVGRMRFQWWRDAVKGAFEGKPPPHPIATLLSSLPQIRTSRLSAYHFTRLINTREAHFLNPSFSSLQDLADYSAGSQASVLYLLLQTLERTDTAGGSAAGAIKHASLFEHKGGEHEGEEGWIEGKGREPDELTIDHAASHLAVATTIAVLLRSIPHHATKRINVIPAEIASRHNLKEEALFRQGPNADGLRESVATLVGIAEAELRTSRACFDGTAGLPARSAPAFLAATPARSFLARLASDAGAFDVFAPYVQKRYWKLPFQVWGDARNKRF